MKPNPVVWFEIYVQDMARARKFYETVLQCQLETLKSPEGEAQNMQMLSFPGDMTTMGASGALVTTAPWNRRASRRPAERSSSRSSRSANTASARW